MFWKKKLSPEEQAMAEACLHLRMVMAGRESYSASVTQVDIGHARLLLERLEVYGFGLTPLERASGGNQFADQSDTARLSQRLMDAIKP